MAESSEGNTAIAKKILVTLGGADPENTTLMIVEALQDLKIAALKAVVVLGGSNPYYRCVENAVKHTKISIELVQDVANMPELMAWADLAVSAGGSTTLELAFMGLPSLGIIFAENQVKILEDMDRLGIISNLGWRHRLDAKSILIVLSVTANSLKPRSKISKNGRELVNGYVSTNVLEKMRKNLKIGSLSDRDS